MDISRRLDRIEARIKAQNRQKYTLILKDGNKLRAIPPDCINLVLDREDVMRIDGQEDEGNGMLLQLLQGVLEE